MASLCKMRQSIESVLFDSFYTFSDLWAIGVITYFLLSGYTPFEGSNNIEEMNAIMNADYNYDEYCWENISVAGKRIHTEFYFGE